MAGKSKIHIKKSTQGSFKRAATKAGKTTAEFANQVLKPGSKATTKMKKKAVFARNARKWDHSK